MITERDPILRKRGLSTVEILIASMILSVSILSFANIFVVAKRKITHSRCRVVAAELSKRYLEPLHSDVRQDIWSTTCLGSLGGSGCFTGVITSAEGVAFTPTYAFSYLGPGANKVKLMLTWNEL